MVLKISKLFIVQLLTIVFLVDVRNAALDSLCELAFQSPQFALLSQDSIIDMFNDEIESVRLNAINSLQKICHHLLFREDQAAVIMGVLQVSQQFFSMKV